MTSSEMDSLYHTSGGLTLDSELVSTTGSGCRWPIFTEVANRRLSFLGILTAGCMSFDFTERSRFYGTTYISLACTLHTSLRGPVRPPLPPQAHPPLSSRGFSVTTDGRMRQYQPAKCDNVPTHLAAITSFLKIYIKILTRECGKGCILMSSLIQILAASLPKTSFLIPLFTSPETTT